MRTIETLSGRQVSRLGVLREVFETVVARLGAWSRVARSRKQLLDLTERELKDLGLTREAAYQEAIRPFWDSNDRWGHRK